MKLTKRLTLTVDEESLLRDNGFVEYANLNLCEVSLKKYEKIQKTLFSLICENVEGNGF